MKRHLLIYLFLLLGGMLQLKAQLFAVKTDLVLDAAMTPNLGFDLVVSERGTVGATLFGNKNPWGQDVSMLGLMPEYRFWLNGRPMTRMFVGAALLAVDYDITWQNQIYDGNAFGLGATFGYDFLLGARWTLECYGSFGAVYYQHKRSYVTDHYNELRYNARGAAFVPFRLGVSLVYIIK